MPVVRCIVPDSERHAFQKKGPKEDFLGSCGVAALDNDVYHPDENEYGRHPVPVGQGALCG